jgi:hypothetical protein
MEIITKEQFDTLTVGDTLKDGHYTLLVEAKFANTIIAMDDEHNACTLSFNELQEEGYSINQPIQHNCGFPFGDYSDKEVIVKVSDKSIEDCTVNAMYTRLIYVDNEGFTDHNGEHWMYAVLVANNVDIIVKP